MSLKTKKRGCCAEAGISGSQRIEDDTSSNNRVAGPLELAGHPNAKQLTQAEIALG